MRSPGRAIPAAAGHGETGGAALPYRVRIVTGGDRDGEMTAHHGRMSDVRRCEQCGTEFVPRREHSRFCSAECRLAWNKENARHAGVSVAALDWSLTAMSEA